MKRRTIIALAICLVVGIMLIWKKEMVYHGISVVKDRIIRSENETDVAAYMKEKTCDPESMPALEDEEDAWYTKYHFIAHAGGGINGKIYTNSLEAWVKSYECGIRVFDADLRFTEDEELVLRHAWSDNIETGELAMIDSNFFRDDNGCVQYRMSEEIMTYDEFMNTKIFYKYTPMDCEDMILFMKEHEDLYVAPDMKGKGDDTILKGYQYLVDKAIGLEAEDVLERIIVNVYDYDVYKEIIKIYPFINATARQHSILPNNYYELAAFCIENNIHVVAVSACFMKDEEIQMLKSKGIHIYVAIADYVSDMKLYHDYGADGAVTNWLYEEDWEYMQK